MKLAVQFGAGNIGRGFIGAVLAKSGYQVVFADVVKDLVDRINADRQYTVHIKDVDSEDILISGVSAVDSSTDAVVEKIKEAELITTAVGLRILQFIAPAIAKGIVARKEAGIEAPLNIIACENGLMASSRLKEAVLSHLDEAQAAWCTEHVGFPDCSVDRIVPPVRSENPIDVAVEKYYEWNVEEKAFVGPAPKIDGMNLADNLLAYIERKLFTLNTSHAITAYVGKMKGRQTIGESIEVPEIFDLVHAAMQQSGEALVKQFGFDHEAHFKYIEKIIKRFRNPYLKDDVNRVGREPLRKLSADDRLIKPIMTAKSFGLPYDKLLLGVGAALHFDNPEDPQSVQLMQKIKSEGLEATIAEVTGIAAGDPMIAEIVKAYHDVEKI